MGGRESQSGMGGMNFGGFDFGSMGANQQTRTRKKSQPSQQENLDITKTLNITAQDVFNKIKEIIN